MASLLESCLVLLLNKLGGGEISHSLGEPLLSFSFSTRCFFVLPFFSL